VQVEVFYIAYFIPCFFFQLHLGNILKATKLFICFPELVARIIYRHI